MKVLRSIRLFSLSSILFLVGCSSEKDFCEYLTIAEAQSFDPTITSTEMRQTERILYCVYKNTSSDRLFVSLDTVMKYSPENFLEIVAQNSSEKYEEIRRLSGFDNEGAVLFLGDDEKQLDLEFIIAQNRDYSVLIRAKEVDNNSSEKLNKLREIAKKVLSRI